MNNLYLYNSLSKSKELFKPISETSIGMYVCGPTVYDYPHLGNALAVVIYDVLFRLLRHLYGQDMVVYVRNITDVDDKIINAALEQNISVSQLTDKITKVFQDNMSKLNCLQPILSLVVE
jgi:cysteinyl-tRNA synthetase